MSEPVALTGATGFIGKAVLKALTARSTPVRALTRRPRRNTDRIQWIPGELHDRQALRRLVSGVGAIIHCAGRVRGGSLKEFSQTNVEGTINMVDAAVAQHPQPRFLFLSSLAAREPHLSWYAASKHQAEQAITEHAVTMPWTVLRPTAVYGPGDREISPLLRLTRYGVLPMAGRSATRFGLLHIDDLVAAILAWLDSETPIGGIYEVDDGTPGGYDCDSLADITGRVWDRPVRPLSLPASIVLMVAGSNLWLSRVFRYSPMLTPGKVRELLHHDWVCDNTPLLRDLQGWRPRVRLYDALRTAV